MRSFCKVFGVAPPLAIRPSSKKYSLPPPKTPKQKDCVCYEIIQNGIFICTQHTRVYVWSKHVDMSPEYIFLQRSKLFLYLLTFLSVAAAFKITNVWKGIVSAAFVVTVNLNNCQTYYKEEGVKEIPVYWNFTNHVWLIARYQYEYMYGITLSTWA